MKTHSKGKGLSWKKKAMLRRQENENLSKKLKRRDRKISRLQERIKILELSPGRQKATYGQHPICLVLLAVYMRIECNISFRAISKAICKMAEIMDLECSSLSPSTVRNWSLKIGYSCYNSPPESGKYVLIIDESVEIGKEHLLLTLLVPISSFSPCVPLSMEDTIVLDLGVQHSWKGIEIQERLSKKLEEYQIEIAYAISDKGHALKNFLSRAEIQWIGDCTHEMANVCKKIFRKHEGFNTLVKKMSALRCKWIMSKNHLLVPPGIRIGNRFNQLFILHRWAEKILKKKDLSPEARKELSFLWEYKNIVKMMRDFHDLIEEFSLIFKGVGITKSSLAKWKKVATKYRRRKLPTETLSFIDAMDKYLKTTTACLPNHERILCCSDVIESTFGKYKNKGGAKIITDDILTIAAYSKVSTIQQVRTAMETIKLSDLQKWKEENTTISKLALIKREKLKSQKPAA